MKRSILLLSLFFTTFYIRANDQVSLTIESLFENLLTLPVEILEDLAGNMNFYYYMDQYNQEKAEKGRRSQNSCVPLDGVLPRGVKYYTNSLQEKVCTCKAWGECPPMETCPCEKLCPMDFSLFDREDNKSLDLSPQNALPFRNSSVAKVSGKQVFSKYPMTQGYCWGHANVSSKFNRLASFRLKNKLKNDKGESLVYGSDEWVSSMKLLMMSLAICLEKFLVLPI
jgi:hypothetical protein